jgi:hypothetical protein
LSVIAATLEALMKPFRQCRMLLPLVAIFLLNAGGSLADDR